MSDYANTHNWLECIICGRQSVDLIVDVNTGECEWCQSISRRTVISDWTRK